MILKTQNINLQLPRGWNQCATCQLETIAECVLRHTIKQDRYHPFDWIEVKTELFFDLTEVELLGEEALTNDNKAYGQSFLCRYKGVEFLMQTWQLHSFIKQHLSWIDDPKAKPLIIFPYKQLLSAWQFTRHFPFVKKQWLAPGEMLQDFSWREYRFLQDYMEMYIRLQNQMATMQQGVIDKARLVTIAEQMLNARNHFLAVLFKVDDMLLFRHNAITKKIGDVQWQVILFWWSGMMHYLQQQFPHCFKQSKAKSGKRPPLPIELYRNIIATVQKESNGLNEDEVNGQTFYIVLEHLERLAKQSEEMEKLNRKHK